MGGGLFQAWYHKVDRKGRTVYQVMKEAMDFAATDYLNALFKGYGALDDATRNRIATTLESFTAIPASYFLANNLLITRPTFQNELFKKEGLKRTPAPRRRVPLTASAHQSRDRRDHGNFGEGGRNAVQPRPRRPAASLRPEVSRRRVKRSTPLV